MIVALDHAYTLRCSGCGGYRSLAMRALRDLDRMIDLKSAMCDVHKDCAGFGDRAKARAAMKARIRAERKAISGGVTR